jgi:TRAP transporter TAXI family solute receptor
VRAILAKHQFLKSITVPAGTYPGQSQPIESVGSWSFVFARNDLPDEVGYRVARALHKAEAGIAKRLPQAKETTAANTYAAAASPDAIHPGVLRYLRDAGIAR